MYFQPMASLPTAKHTSLGDNVGALANATVLQEVQAAQQPRKRKMYTSFTAEQIATIGKFAS